MVILVTGISSGFGLAVAKELVRRGHTVYGTVRRDVPEESGIRYLRMDVQDEGLVRSAVETLISEQGRIDVLVNNAGSGIGGPLEFSSEEDIKLQMDVNFMGLVRTVKAVLPYMRAQKSGKIIAFSSIAGVLGIPYQGYYSASKFAIEGFCESLRMEVRHCGIKVTVIRPGDFRTEFTSKRRKVCSPEAFKAYPSYERSMLGIEHDENTGLTPDCLARKLAVITEKKNPACHYVIATLIQKSSIFLKHILPAMWFSRMIGWFYKL